MLFAFVRDFLRIIKSSPAKPKQKLLLKAALLGNCKSIVKHICVKISIFVNRARCARFAFSRQNLRNGKKYIHKSFTKNVFYEVFTV